MKSIVKILCISFLIVSCNNDDDNTPVIENEGFFSLQLSKDFLLDEKWYLYQASRKDTGEDLLTNPLACELDSFYIFEQFQADSIFLNQGDTECDNELERYGPKFYDLLFSDDENSRSIIFDIEQNFLLGGFLVRLSQISNVEFLVAEDSSKKIFKGVIYTEVEGVLMDVNYSLIAYPTDRP